MLGNKNNTSAGRCSTIDLSTKAEWCAIICLGAVLTVGVVGALVYLSFISPSGWAVDDTIVSVVAAIIAPAVMSVMGLIVNSIFDKRKMRQNDKLAQVSIETTKAQGELNRQQTKELAKTNIISSLVIAAASTGVTTVAGAFLLGGAMFVYSGQSLPEFLQSCKSNASYCLDIATTNASSLRNSLVACRQQAISTMWMGDISQVQKNLSHVMNAAGGDGGTNQQQVCSGSAFGKEQQQNVSSWRRWSTKLQAAAALGAIYLCYYQYNVISFYLGEENPSYEMTHPNASSASNGPSHSLHL